MILESFGIMWNPMDVVHDVCVYPYLSEIRSIVSAGSKLFFSMCLYTHARSHKSVSSQ